MEKIGNIYPCKTEELENIPVCSKSPFNDDQVVLKETGVVKKEQNDDTEFSDVILGNET